MSVFSPHASHRVTGDQCVACMLLVTEEPIRVECVLAGHPRPALDARLLAAVRLHCDDDAVLTCAFVPGGKLHGVGIPSSLYCRRCGHAAIWHDVAQAAAIVAAAADVEEVA